MEEFGFVAIENMMNSRFIGFIWTEKRYEIPIINTRIDENNILSDINQKIPEQQHQLQLQLRVLLDIRAHIPFSTIISQSFCIL